jgi:ribosomal protein S18 acetylase RimI-like enzyme
MPLIPARREHQHQIHQLVRTAHHAYINYGNEDLVYFLNQGCSTLGVERARPWGFLCLELEERPLTLPWNAPARAHVRGVVLVRGRSPAVDVAKLLESSESRLRARVGAATSRRGSASPKTQISYFGSDHWLKKPLLSAGFQIVERVEFLYLEQLQRREVPTMAAAPEIRWRAAQTTDVERLAHLDSAAFEPHWHFGQKQMLELLMSCRVQVAEFRDILVGYSALSVTPALSSHEAPEAHLARLAVHPHVQGSGLGRALLLDTLHFAQRQGIQGVMLNTQTVNHRAQRLYRSMGFRSTGQIIPLFIKEIDVTGKNVT